MEFKYDRDRDCPKTSAGKRLKRGFFPEYHQRSWWIVHTQPTEASATLVLSRIPPTQLVDRSYSAYKSLATRVLSRIKPKISVEQVALSLMNNGQYFGAKHFPLMLVEAKIDQRWQPSAYVGTCGELTTALLKAFLRGADAG